MKHFYEWESGQDCALATLFPEKDLSVSTGRVGTTATLQAEEMSLRLSVFEHHP